MCFFGRKKKKAKEEEARRLAEAKAKAEEEKKTAKKATSSKNQPKTKKPAKSQAKEVKTEEEVDVEVVEKARKAIYRVVFDKEDRLWKIKKDGAKRVIDSFVTKDEALARVQELSQSQDHKFVVYKKDGKFQKKANLNLKNSDKEEN